MSTGAIRSNPGLLPAGLATLCLLLAVSPPATLSWLEFDRDAVLAGQFWRLWTGHLVHYSPSHALLDAAALLLAGTMAARAAGTPRVCLALALGAPFIALELLMTVPDCRYYRGASGINIMLAVLAAAALWSGAGRWSRTVLALLAVALAAKITNEALGMMHDWRGWSDLPQDVAIAWQAHLLGAVAGGAATLGLRAAPG